MYSELDGRIISEQEFQQWTTDFQARYNSTEVDYTKFEFLSNDVLEQLEVENRAGLRIYGGSRVNDEGKQQITYILVPVDKDGNRLRVALGGMKDDPGAGGGSGPRCPVSCG